MAVPPRQRGTYRSISRARPGWPPAEGQGTNNERNAYVPRRRMACGGGHARDGAGGAVDRLGRRPGQQRTRPDRQRDDVERHRRDARGRRRQRDDERQCRHVLLERERGLGGRFVHAEQDARLGIDDHDLHGPEQRLRCQPGRQRDQERSHDHVRQQQPDVGHGDPLDDQCHQPVHHVIGRHPGRVRRQR